MADPKTPFHQPPSHQSQGDSPRFSTQASCSARKPTIESRETAASSFSINQMLTSNSNHRSIVLLALLFAVSCSPVNADRPNVLFIAVDDLRPELNCFGRDHIHSPNIDALAASGVLFERSYCMVPTCGASRSSLMTGIRPSRNRFVNYLTRADKDAPGVVTLNTHFKNNGYTTISLGKIFHHRDDSAQGWSEPAWRPKGPSYHNSESNAVIGQKNSKGRTLRGPSFEISSGDDMAHRDGQIATKAVEELGRLAGQEEPFFLAVGFFKPHLPFVAPKKYWDLYDPSEIELPENYRLPSDVPDGAVHTSGELRAYYGIPATGPVSAETARNLIHGYYACVSFTDAQIGRVMNELDRLGIADNTIVVLWGDHGWNLGDHTMWCKHSCFESSMHAPLIVRAPGAKAGAKTSGLTEFIDIYPSLCELSGLDLPEHLQGKSFVPLLENPQMPWKEFAIGRYQAGDTIRTDEFRFTQYSKKNGQPTGNMLYNHRVDPLENTNVGKTQTGKAKVRSLRKVLHANMGRD